MRTLLALLPLILLRGPLAAEDDVVVLVHDGIQRTSLVHVGPATGGPRPLLLALHGGGGAARSMRDLSEGGLDRLADRDGAVVAYPAGVDRQWNDGRADPSAGASHADDVGFLIALIDELDRRHGIDRDRVCATGMSNGAMMCLRLARERPEVFRAVAPVTGLVPEPLAALPWPGSTSVLLILGVADPLVPFAGGAVGAGRGEVVSTAASVAILRAQAGVADVAAEVARLPDLAPLDGTRATEYRWRAATAPDAVHLIAIAGGGHTWPGGRQYLPEWIIGRTCRDFDANRAIWRFCFER